MIQFLTTTEAQEMARPVLGRLPDRGTIISWCRRFGIGHQDDDGRWLVDPVRLENLLASKNPNQRRLF